MNSSTERRDGGDDLPREARDLLRKAARPVPPTAAERAAMAAMAARIAAVPLPPSPRGAWSKLAALGGGKVGVAAVVLAVGGAAWLGATMLEGRSTGAGDTSGDSVSAAVTAAPTGADPVSARDVGTASPGGGRTGSVGDRQASGEGATAGTTVSHAPGAVPEEGKASVAGGGLAGGVAAAPVSGSKDGKGPSSGSPTEKSGSLAAKSGSRSAGAGDGGGAKGAVGGASPKGAVGGASPKGAVGGAETDGAPGGASSGAATPPAKEPVAPVAPVSGCPVGTAIAGDRAAEGPILAAAAKALSASPLVTLACVQQLAKIGGPFQLKDEQTFLAFEASRRLGREADAKRFARALLRASPGSAYAAKARAYLGDAAGP